MARWDLLVAAVASVHAADHARRRDPPRRRPLRRAARPRAGSAGRRRAPWSCRTPAAAACPARATPAWRRRAGRWSRSSTTTPRPPPTGSSELVAAYGDPHVSGSAGSWSAVGRRARRPGSRRSSAGSSAAPTPASRSTPRRCATRSAPTCRSGAIRVLAVGGFRVEVGRVGADAARLRGDRAVDPARAARDPASRILHEPRAVVHHHVPGDRGQLGLLPAPLLGRGAQQGAGEPAHRPRPAALAQRARLRPQGAAARSRPRRPRRRCADRDPRSARPGRSHRRRARPHRRLATPPVPHAPRPTHHPATPENTMQGHQMPASGWLNFDIHGKVGMRSRPRRPARRSCRRCSPASPSDREVPADIVVSERPEPMPDAALLEDELAYTERAVRFVRQRVQVVLEEDAVPRARRRRAADHARPRARPGDGQPRRGDDPRGDGRLPGAGDRPAGRRWHRQDQHRGQADAPRGLDLHGRRLGLPVRRRPAARLREAHVHQAAPQGDLPAPVRRGPQAAGAGAALPRRWAGSPPWSTRS